MSGDEYTLHEIEDAIREVIANAVDPETGLIDDQADAELDGLLAKKHDKLVGYAVVWKEMQGQKQALVDEVDRLNKRAQRIHTRQLWLEGRLSDSFAAIKGVCLSDPRAEVSKTRSERTEVPHPLSLPRKLLRFHDKPPPEANLAEVKKALQGKTRLTPHQREQLEASGASIAERFKLKIE